MHLRQPHQRLPSIIICKRHPSRRASRPLSVPPSHDEQHAFTPQPRAAPTSITPAARISCCPDHHNGPGSNDPGHTSCAHRDGNASACERANASMHVVAVCDARCFRPPSPT
ncbi:hypothetical protein ACLOJK_017267 [Asimina triloba]